MNYFQGLCFFGRFIEFQSQIQFGFFRLVEPVNLLGCDRLERILGIRAVDSTQFEQNYRTAARTLLLVAHKRTAFRLKRNQRALWTLDFVVWSIQRVWRPNVASLAASA